jgi:hypothetical protein
MGKLQNCQDVTPWSSLEFAGDGPSNNTLEAQSPPAGYNVPFVGSQTAFYLTIKPDAYHTIDRTKIDIHDNNDSALSETLSAINYVVTYPADFSNGIAQYFLYDHADFPDIYEIRLFDAFGDNWNDPNNFVIAQIIMEPDFVMPASNHVISIDFEGKAVGFEPPPPDTPQTYEYVANNFTYDSELFFTNTTATDGFEIFLAHGYESAEFANSLYNLNANRLWMEFIPGEDTVSQGMVWWPPYFDNNGYYQQYADYNNNSFTNGWQDLEDGTNYLESFDPTYYTPYLNTFEQDGMYNTSTTEAPHTIETTCGQLFLQNEAYEVGGGNPSWNSLNFTNTQFPNHPNGDAQPNRTNAKNRSIVFRWGKSCGDDCASWRCLCIEDYPTISPGDIAVSGLTLNSNIYGGGILPSYLEWYISLGENPNYKLSAVPEVIDVWKIITWEDVDDVSAYPYGGADPMIDQYPPNMDCLGLADGTSELHPNFWYKVSDSTTNESDLDINNIQLFPVNNTTVRMRIPFKSGLSLERYTPTEFIGNHRRENKIFINIYPLLIT